LNSMAKTVVLLYNLLIINAVYLQIRATHDFWWMDYEIFIRQNILTRSQKEVKYVYVLEEWVNRISEYGACVWISPSMDFPDVIVPVPAMQQPEWPREILLLVRHRDGNGYPWPAYPPGKNPIGVRVWDTILPMGS
jgi:hypothetical protein